MSQTAGVIAVGWFLMTFYELLTLPGAYATPPRFTNDQAWALAGC
jgi:hypothetical protein